MYEIRERDGSVSASSENWQDITSARKGDAVIYDTSRWAVAGQWLPVTREQVAVPTLAMSARESGGE
jgi:hypothetical protein